MRPMELCMSNALKCSLIGSSPRQGKSFLVQSFSLVRGIWGWGEQILLVETREKKMWTTQDVSTWFFYFNNSHIFQSIFCCCSIPTFLTDIQSTHQIQYKVGFVFPNHVSAVCLYSFLVTSPASLYSTLSLFVFFFGTRYPFVKFSFYLYWQSLQLLTSYQTLIPS